MRLILISDTHGLHYKMRHPIPEGDVLIHAGDFTDVGNLVDVRKFDAWVGSLGFKHVITIAGNHERKWDSPEASLGAVFQNVHYLQDSSINIDGINFYGSPWTPTFGYGWAFNADRGNAIQKYWNMIPEAGCVDVLITHGPPLGICDKTDGRYGPPEHVGCWDLRNAVEDSVPKVHVFGHIHNGYGQKQIGQTLYVNAAVCDEDYKPVNAPIVVDI